MKKQIEQIMKKVESGDLTYHDAVDETVRLMDLYQQHRSLQVLDMLKKLIKAIPLGACIEEKQEAKELINGYKK